MKKDGIFVYQQKNGGLDQEQPGQKEAVIMTELPLKDDNWLQYGKGQKGRRAVLGKSETKMLVYSGVGPGRGVNWGRIMRGRTD